MININVNNKERKIHNFWNNVHFHPTDAIEDIWGKRILESISNDRVAKYVRIYAMLEDVVSIDDEGNIVMDFTLTDSRIDYMIEKGFGLLICMNFMPSAIASDKLQVSFFARYKNKRINTSAPCDYELWQKVCNLYAAHLVERYGIELVSTWYFHCWNEPDLEEYWMTGCEDKNLRFEGYCKLYDHFAKGFSDVSDKLKLGGPSVAFDMGFIRDFINHTKSGVNYATGSVGAKYDFFSIHTYGQAPDDMMKTCIMTPVHTMDKIKIHRNIADECGYKDIEIIVDEWEACSLGFKNEEYYSALVYRNNEHFSAFYFSLIDCYLKANVDISKMMICLSGQHNLSRDFEGYRNFFTLSGFKKPIYNAYVLAARLGDTLLGYESDDGVGVIPTIDDEGNIAIALYNISYKLTQRAAIRHVKLRLTMDDGIYRVLHTRIDGENCNSFSKWCQLGRPVQINQTEHEQIELAGELKPWYPEEIFEGNEYTLDVVMSENALSFIEIHPIK